jgi:hypothetical protein
MLCKTVKVTVIYSAEKPKLRILMRSTLEHELTATNPSTIRVRFIKSYARTLVTFFLFVIVVTFWEIEENCRFASREQKG